MNKATAVPLKCQRNNNEASASSLGKELETAKILQQLSSRNTSSNIPDNRVVSLTSSCGRLTSGTHKKRRICDVGTPSLKLNAPPTSVADNHNQSSMKSVTSHFELPFLLFPDDDFSSFSSSTSTDAQEGLSESRNTLSFENTGYFFLGKVAIKPLMQPPQMRYFNNFSNPIGPPNLVTRIPAQVSEQRAEKTRLCLKPQKTSNKVVKYSSSPTYLFHAIS